MHKLAIIMLLLIVAVATPRSAFGVDHPQPCKAISGSMAQTTVPSAIYSKPVAVNVYLPPCYTANRASAYPVIYLLHGGSADETQWPDLNVQRAADALIAGG